jgi:hypothetical protein
MHTGTHRGIWAAAAAAAWLAGCETPRTASPPPPVLTLSSDLHSACYRWPAGDFTLQNHATLETSLSAGEPAVDFTLADVDGATVHLAELLAEKPVLLVLGSFT